MCTETKADSCRARQCISSDSTVFPLPPYCSSTRGLAYDITLTKADGNSGVSCIDVTCLASWWISTAFEMCQWVKPKLLRDFCSLKY